MRLALPLLLLVACQDASPHRRIYDAQFQESHLSSECGGPSYFLPIPTARIDVWVDTRVACADEADRQVPDAAEFWRCKADEYEDYVACIERLCRPEGWEACREDRCPPLPDEVASDWKCANQECLGAPLRTDPSGVPWCGEVWTPIDPSPGS